MLGSACIAAAAIGVGLAPWFRLVLVPLLALRREAGGRAVERDAPAFAAWESRVG